MKKIICALCMLIAGSIAANAQCNKNVRLTSSATEYLDSAFTLQRKVDEKSIIELTDKEMTIAPGSENRIMKGVIQSNTCNWTVPYKEGKSIVKATMNDDQGNTKNVVMTIEGNDGKLSLLVEITEMPNQKIRVLIDRFVEKQ